MKASLPYKYIISVKNGKHYVVFDFKDKAGKRKRKWASTGLPEKCTKKALNEAVEQIVAEFAESWITTRSFSMSAERAAILLRVMRRSLSIRSLILSLQIGRAHV